MGKFSSRRGSPQLAPLDAIGDRRHRGSALSEELEFRRRLAEHERRFLRPARADLDELAAAIGYRGDEPGAAIWARAIAAARLPRDWADDPGRRFRATERELAKRGPADAESFPDRGGRARRLLATPPTARAALLLASDPAGLAAAERLARTVVERFEIWGAPKVRRIAWRLAGNPVDRVNARPAPLGALGPANRRLHAALSGTARIYEPAHEHLRFAPVASTLHAARRRERLLGSTIPARIRLAGSEVEMPTAVVGRSFAELPDPLGPWLELWRLGYSLWAITDSPAGAVLELAAPFPPPRELAPRRPRLSARVPKQARREQSFPRAVWSAKLGALRLACARADSGTIRRELPLLAGDDEPGQARLIHFAVYGGPEPLAALAELGHAELQARDAEGRTALMLAAALPREGPSGAARHEIDVPISDLVGAAACEWLLAAGADPDARDPLGQTALHFAAPNHRLHAVAALVEGGADVDAVDVHGRTALMRAVGAAAQPELVEILLAAGADPDLRDVHGSTALHYLAATPSSASQRDLARRLQARGARPSRDRAGRSPADLYAMQGELVRDGGPLDPSTPVAAGPGPLRVELEPTLAAELVAELVPEPGVATRIKPGTGDGWQVWADWLQTRGDPRGEYVAGSLARARVGSRRARKLAADSARVEQRWAPAFTAGHWQAYPLYPARSSPIWLTRTHGFVTKAWLSGLWWRRLSGLSGSARIAGALVEAVRALTTHEPLLAELRIDVMEPESWAIVLAGLRGLEPAHRVRRLVLDRLPQTMPELVDLHSQFPGLRSLWLRGAGKLTRGVVVWPGPVELRLRHGDTSEWTQGGVDLKLTLPDVRHLDFALPVGMRTIPAEVEGCAATLARFDRVAHLRLQPLAPEFAQAIFAGPVIDRLRTLELVGVRGRTLELLLGYVAKLRRLERVQVSLTRTVADQRARELEQLRAELPALELREV